MKEKISRRFQVLRFKFLKLVYKAAGQPLVRRLAQRIHSRSQRALVLGASGLVIIMVLFSAVFPDSRAAAQTLNLGANDMRSGTAQYGGIQLAQAGTQLQLQKGAVGSWDASTADGMQNNTNYVRGVTSLAYGPNDMLYYLSASNDQCYFKSYDTELQAWNILKSVPVGCGAGSKIIADGGKYIYYLAGGATNFLFRYDISNNSWSRMADFTSQIGDISDAKYITNGSQGYIYVFRGGSSASFWRYNISLNQWDSMAPFPTSSNVTNGVAITWDGVDTIYALSNQVGEFKKYSIAANTWTNLTNVSMADIRVTLTYAGGTVYATRVRVFNQFDQATLMGYNVSAGTWSAMPPPPVPSTEYDWSPPSAYDGSRYIYVQLGTEYQQQLYRYDTIAQTWNSTSLFTNGQDTSDWHYNPIYDGSNNLYYVGGSGQGSTDRVFKYDMTTRVATQVGAQIGTPSGWKGVYKSGDIYMLPRDAQTAFQKYDTSTNSFTPLATLPFPVTYGLDIVDGNDGYLYVSFGGRTNFQRYNIATDTWSALTAIPQTIGQGGDLTRIGTTIYASIGNQTGFFYKYNMSNNTWALVTSNVPNGSIGHGGFMTSDSSRYVYIGTGERTDSTDRRLWRYDTTNDTWQRLADLPAATNVNASAFFDTTNSKLYVSPSWYSSRLWNWSPSAASFVQSGTWYSKPLSLNQVQNWTSLTATTGGTGTTTIYTRTSSAGRLWTAWQATTGTTINSPTNKYIQMKVVLTGNGTATPTVSNLAVNYGQETSPPSLPSQFTALSKQGGATLTTGQTYEWEHPYFTWNGADDGANGSGVAGYYVYFGTDSNADPVTDGNYQAGSSYTVTTPMTAGDLYYIRIKAKDNLGNVSSAATYFSYRYWYISPPGSQVMTSDQDFSNGNNTRVSISNGAMQLRQQASGVWSLGGTSMLPDTTNNPAEVVVGDYLYVMRGATTATMWRYDLVNKSWASMNDAPSAFDAGSSLTWDGNNYIYAMAGNGTTSYYRYDIQNNTWSTMPVLPARAQLGSSVQYLGNNLIAVFFTGAREFYFYNISNGTFSTKNSYPSNISVGGSGIWYDGSDNIYAYMGTDTWSNYSNNSRANMVKYSISTDTWKVLAPAPVSAINAQNNLVGDGHGGLYIFNSDANEHASKDQMAYRYDIASNTWDEANGLNTQVYFGSAVSDGDRYIYILPSQTNTSREMIRYDTWNKTYTPTTKAIDKWERMVWDAPVNAWMWQAGTASTAAYDGSKYVYMIGSDEASWSRFVRFDPTTGDTTYLPSPYYTSQGGSLAFLNGQLYYIRGGTTKQFYKYDIDNQQWMSMADTPGNALRPGPSALQAVGGNLYLAAGSGTAFYAYTPDSGMGSWATKASAPGTILNGSAVYDSTGNYIYVLAGNTTANFYRYNVSANTWSTMAALPLTTAHGSALTIEDGKIYAASGTFSTNTYVYDISGNSWSAGADAPDQFRTGSSFIKIDDAHMLAIPGDNSPDIYQFNFPKTNSAYDGSAIHISQPMTIAGIYDYAGISAQVDTPAGTDVEFWTRSSDDGVNWDKWTITTDVKRYNGQMTARVMSTPRKYTQLKTILSSSDNLYTPTVSSYALNYYFDVDPPSNPSVINVYQNSSSSNKLTSNTWYNYSAPLLDWPDPGEPGGATDGPLGSNIGGYGVYLGTDPTASPRTAGQFVTDSQFAPNLQASGIYYLRIQAQDVTGNVDSNVYAPFVYKFDNAAPTAPSLVTVTPGGFTTTNNFTFDWPAAFDANSGVAGYCYHTGATSGAFADEICQTGRNLTDISAAYRTGTNVFYVRTIDNAGNYSNSYTTVSYYYSTDPPSPPTNLRAIPPTSAQNLFAFAWDLPSLYSGDPDQLDYCYSVNELPTSTNTTCTGDRFLSAFKAATRQGTNIIYMVTKDEAGNVNWNNYTTANFIANTVSPGIPLNLVLTDTSDRVSQRWSLTLTWDQPTFTGNGISKYIIERSLDGHSFTEIGNTSNAAYVDLDVQPGITYYYRVRAADNVDNRGGPSGTVSKSPQGSFSEPPGIVLQPQAEAGFDQADIHWVTSRSSTSFVYYGTSPSDLGQSKGSLNLTSDHKLTISGLQPSSTYYYRVQSFDNDRSYDLANAYSQIFYFKTTDSARIYNVATDGVTLNSGVLNWQTSVPTKTTIQYGTGLSYGMTASDGDNFSGNHLYKLSGLQSGTTYHYRIVATTSFGSVVKSDDYTFKTISRPVISSIEFEPLEDEASTAVRVTWNTNVPTSSTVNYQGSGVQQESSTSDLVTSHSMVLTGLASSTDYVFSIQGRDQYGNLAASEDQHWKSSYDTRPPAVSDIGLSMTTTDNVGNTRAQLIVTWKTDEPATSQVSYDKSNKKTLSKKTPLDTEPTTNHVVVISNLDLADIYKVQIISKDISGNTAYGTPTMVVTPDKETSVLDNVLNLMTKLFRF
jgi:hypothetical protein